VDGSRDMANSMPSRHLEAETSKRSIVSKYAHPDRVTGDTVVKAPSVVKDLDNSATGVKSTRTTIS